VFKPEVIQGLPLLQLLLQLIHRPLLFFNDKDTHNKLLCLLDGVIGSGLGWGVQLFGLCQRRLRVAITVVDGSL
jgi:hypothetical protein